jgi:hypothetical protein
MESSLLRVREQTYGQPLILVVTQVGNQVEPCVENPAWDRIEYEVRVRAWIPIAMQVLDQVREVLNEK